jgi:hypothetical protein
MFQRPHRAAVFEMTVFPVFRAPAWFRRERLYFHAEAAEER